MATFCHTYEETRSNSPQIPEETAGTAWRDKVKNEDVRKNTGLRKLEDIIKKKKAQMAGTRLENGQLQNSSPGHTVKTERSKRKPGRPKKNWMDVIKRDLKNMYLTSKEAEVRTNDKAEWRQRVAQCSYLDAG